MQFHTNFLNLNQLLNTLISMRYFLIDTHLCQITPILKTIVLFVWPFFNDLIFNIISAKQIETKLKEQILVMQVSIDENKKNTDEKQK